MHGVAWSAAALKTHPEVVRQVHEDFIRAGADIVITNTFATARHVLEHTGMGGMARRGEQCVARVWTSPVTDVTQQRRHERAGG